MESSKIYLTEEQLDILISKGVLDWYETGLKFLGWRIPYEMLVVDKKKWMLAKIKYGI